MQYVFEIMILSDRDMLAKIDSGEIRIESPHENWRTQVGASSLDLRLGKYFKIYEHGKFPVLDPSK